MKPSIIFWNSLGLIILIASYFIIDGLLPSLLIMGSIISMAIFIDDDDDLIKKHLWIFLMPITWIFGIGLIVILLFIWFEDNVIFKFNKWLNKKFNK